MEGQVVAKFCNKCKRYTKGASAHFTSEHKSKGGTKTEAKPTDVSPSASLAAIDDAPALLRCEIPDYDTPTLGQRDAFSDDEASIDSTYNAFVAAAVPPSSDTKLNPEPVDELMVPYMAYPDYSDWWSHLNEYRGQSL